MIDSTSKPLFALLVKTLLQVRWCYLKQSLEFDLLNHDGQDFVSISFQYAGVAICNTTWSYPMDLIWDHEWLS